MTAREQDSSGDGDKLRRPRGRIMKGEKLRGKKREAEKEDEAV